jgi:hypothetical protein
MSNGNEWLVRASGIGALMTKGRGTEFGETAMNLIREAVLWNKYGIERNISSKHIEKGIINEDESLEMAVKYLFLDVDLSKPKKRLSNQWIIGEPDLCQNGILIDVKNSWDGTTFPWFDKEVPNKTYFWQLQAYMWLSALKSSKLIYTLTNAPEHLIFQEAQRNAYKLQMLPKYYGKTIDELMEIAEDRARNELTFDRIPEEKRIKVFTVDRCDESITQMRERVESARKIYEQLYNEV